MDQESLCQPLGASLKRRLAQPSSCWQTVSSSSQQDSIISQAIGRKTEDGSSRTGIHPSSSLQCYGKGIFILHVLPAIEKEGWRTTHGPFLGLALISFLSFPLESQGNGTQRLGHAMAGTRWMLRSVIEEPIFDIASVFLHFHVVKDNVITVERSVDRPLDTSAGPMLSFSLFRSSTSNGR